MPSYLLICKNEDCRAKTREIQRSFAARAEMRCVMCGSPLENDYPRHKTAGFVLAGDNWPGKMVKLENHLIKEGGG